MIYVKFFNSFVNEMAEIDKRGQKLSVDGKPLKSLTLTEIEDNILYYRCDKRTFMFDEGDTYLWFIKDNKLAEDFSDGQNLLFFPPSLSFGRNAPINDIWKKNNLLQKNIIGCIKAYTEDNLIYIDMMSVRPGYMKNGINNFMIQFLISQFPNAQLKFSKPTKEGKEFIQRNYPTAKIEGILSQEDLNELLKTIESNGSLFKYTTLDLKSATDILKIPITQIKFKEPKIEDYLYEMKKYLKIC